MSFTLLSIPELFGLSIEVYVICFIIALVTFLICKRLLKTFIKVDKRRKVAAWTVGLIATPVIYFALIRLLMFLISYTPSRDFDKAQWLKDREGRFQMAGDIIESKMLLGKDTSQVKHILGDGAWGNTDSTFIYDMGFGGGGLGFMSHHLIVKFDNNKVVSVEHVKIRD